MRTRVDGTRARMRRVASTAPTEGISIPIKTSSGRSEAASSTASPPSRAQPTTSKRSSALSILISFRARRRSPSARRTRIAPEGGTLAAIGARKDAASRASCEEAPEPAKVRYYLKREAGLIKLDNAFAAYQLGGTCPRRVPNGHPARY